jgi:hypothetical protein
MYKTYYKYMTEEVLATSHTSYGAYSQADDIK